MPAFSPLAGKPAPESILVDVPRLVTAYYTQRPDPSVPAQRVVFGTSGHRGSSLDGAFNTRIDAPATPEQKAKLEKLSPEEVTAATLAGEPITSKVTTASGNNAPLGGIKVVSASGWFAARPSGTESIYKIYAESFTSQAHLDAIVSEAQAMVHSALESADPGQALRRQ